tara:strand:- start:42850 stop:43056 length:207 start_codon:yes stop_codon:yes gene_type:complete
MEIYTVTIEVEVPFHEYDTAAKNKKARQDIKNWLKESLRDYIPLYVERDKNGSFIEDCSNKIKAKVKP